MLLVCFTLLAEVNKMDFSIGMLILACMVILVILVFAKFALRFSTDGEPSAAERPAEVNAPERRPARQPVIIGGQRRNVAGAFRRRLPDVASELPPDDDAVEADSAEDATDEMASLGDSKLGKKKMAKLQAKADKKLQRESELEDRQRRKQLDIEREKEAVKRAELERQEELAREQAERLLCEQRAKREHEEYLKLKESFLVEEEGCDEQDSDEQSAELLREFVSYLKATKITNLDLLAAQFSMKVPDVVSRILALLAEGVLTGVIDDRGKFIYITEDELKAVAKFVLQRGKVTVAEIAQYSNRLIQLEAVAR